MGDMFDTADSIWAGNPIEPGPQPKSLPTIVHTIQYNDKFVVYNRTDFWGFPTQRDAQEAVALMKLVGERVAWTPVENFRINQDFLMRSIRTNDE